MFNGSEHFNNDYFKAVEPVGATDLNGTTNEDRTNYFQNVPVAALDRILWLESDRMGHLLGVVDQARLDEQRGVVQNEKRHERKRAVREGRGSSLSREHVSEGASVLLVGDRLHGGSVRRLARRCEALVPDVLRCRPTRRIVLAGDIDPKTAREKVEKYFGAIPPGPPLIGFEQWVPKMTGVRRQRMQDRVPQARIYKAWNLPPFGTADADAHRDRWRACSAGGSRHGSTSAWSTAIDWPPTSTCTSTTARLPVSCWSGPTAQPGGDLTRRRESARRRGDRVAGRRADAGRTRARADRLPRQVRPRRRTHRGLRRQVRRAGPRAGAAESARGVQGHPARPCSGPHPPACSRPRPAG